MKTLLNILVIILIGSVSYAQKNNAFYDASALREKAKNGKIVASKDVLQVLYNYESYGREVVDASTVQQAYQDNQLVIVINCRLIIFIDDDCLWMKS